MSFPRPPGKPDFQLIETLRWTPAEGHYLLGLHLERLQRSAKALGFTCDSARIRQALERRAINYPLMPQRVRLCLHTSGDITLTARTFDWPASNSPVRCVLSNHTVHSHNSLLQHKTTRRQLFDDEHRHCQTTLGADEALFTNEQGHLTEGSRNTLFIQVQNKWLTPSLDSGLLDGVLRQHLLQTRADIHETLLFPKDLITAERLFIGNSLHGLRPAVYLGAAPEGQ